MAKKTKSKAVSLELYCHGCGNKFIAGFISGVVRRIVNCTRCANPVFTSGKPNIPEGCPGCKRPYVDPESKACAYCGRPKSQREANKAVSLHGKDRTK